MRSPNFLVAASVVLCLGIFVFLLKALRPMLPPNEPSDLFDHPSDFLRQGAYQQIRWFPLGPEPFAEARRLDRPIMLVIGASWSEAARRTDKEIFIDPDIESFIQRHFISVRVDALQSPDWLNRFLPLARAGEPLGPGFQVWFLDPGGEMYMMATGVSVNVEPTSGVFLNELVEARDLLKRIRKPTSLLDKPGVQQRADLQRIMERQSGVPDFPGHLQQLLGISQNPHGGFPRWGAQELWPHSWTYLLAAGQFDAFRKSLDPVLRSSVVDWLDGGFFRRSQTADWSRVEFDKLAVSNAEMMQMLAVAGMLLDDPYYERLAKSTFDSLVGSFAQSGWIATARIGDETPAKRSMRSSFAAKNFRRYLGSGFLTEEQIAYCQEVLGLTVETNPQMVIRLADPARISQDPRTFQDVMERLRAHKEGEPVKYTSVAYADVNGHVIASMIFCARLWGDSKRLQLAGVLFDRLAGKLAFNNVPHTLNLEVREQSYLTDYLAFSDAALQDYLATGRVVSLEKGLSALERAKDLYSTDVPGAWALSVADIESTTTDDVRAPEVLDNVRESATAQMIRLTGAYSHLLRDRDARSGSRWPKMAAELSQAAADGVGQFATLMGPVGSPASGYYCAALGVMDDAHAIAVGPDAQRLANALFKRVPTRLVVPAFNIVRPDLQKRQPGIYIVRNLEAIGPLSVDEAERQIGVVVGAPPPVF